MKKRICRGLILTEEGVLKEYEHDENAGLEDLYKELKCEFVDHARYLIGDRVFDFLVDDVGLLNGRRRTVVATEENVDSWLYNHVCLHGSVFICHSKDEWFTSLTDDDIEYIKGFVKDISGFGKVITGLNF